jgi:twitching motility protein PilT
VAAAPDQHPVSPDAARLADEPESGVGDNAVPDAGLVPQAIGIDEPPHEETGPAPISASTAEPEPLAAPATEEPAGEESIEGAVREAEPEPMPEALHGTVAVDEAAADPLGEAPVAPLDVLAPQAPELPTHPEEPESGTASPAMFEPFMSSAAAAGPDAASDEAPRPSSNAESDTAMPAEPDQPVESVMPAASVETNFPALKEQTPALAVSSGSASTVLVSTVTPVLPMEPVRQVAPPADVPPSRPATPPEAPAAEAVENSAGLPDAPVTRTVRIEVPARALPPSRPAGIDRLLRAADSAGASELFVISQAQPYVRVGGNVRPLQDEAPLLPSDIEALIADVTPEPWREAVRRGDPAEWLIELAEIGRVRCSTFRDHRGPGANFHFAFLRATTADDLQLSAETRLLATEPDGLILVAGGAGSDASAIVAAFVDILNHQRADYIITLEPQIRALHINREALVSQREVGHDGARALMAARAALREEPDVLVIEGIATAEMALLAIDAAAQDRLVIASVDAPSGVAAIQHLVELVPAEQRQTARATLARCFRGAVAQLLLRKVTGGRVAARELLSGTRAVARILADGDLATLAEPLSMPGIRGMAPLIDAIVEYVHAGVVDVREAIRKAPAVDLLIDRLRMAGVDVSDLVAEKSRRPEVRSER